jgi:hypothetical protein
MADRFLKLIPSDETRYLARKHPNAFILLFFIADRARRENGHPDGLTIGQCHIGDHKEYGLTEKEYRNAKKILSDRGHVKIIETCRTRKNKINSKSTLNFKKDEKWADKRATRSTTIGTLVELCISSSYDINSDLTNHQKGDRKGDRGATEGRPKGDEQEGIRSISNDIQEDARSAKQPRTKDILNFNFEKMEFEGILEKDLSDWRLIYPHLDLMVETLKAAQWLKSNPSKSKKKNWRRYLTGWFGRSNDSVENKKAYRSAGSIQQDRRTKDINGNPVDSPHTGRF